MIHYVLEKRFIIKITLNDETKILDDKVKANQAHYDLEREKQLTFLHFHLKNWTNWNI